MEEVVQVVKQVKMEHLIQEEEAEEQEMVILVLYKKEVQVVQV